MKKTVKSMRNRIIADTVEYCTADKKFLGLLIILAIIISAILRYLSSISFGNDFKYEEVVILFSTIYIGNIIVFGYGLQVTKDVIDGGRRLPKIMVKKGLSLGIKALYCLLSLTPSLFH